MFEVMLSHFIADFMLQPKWMAIQKTKSTAICALHCLIYSIPVSAVIALTMPWQWWIPLAVFIPHFVIDRTALAYWWMVISKNRDFTAAYKKRDSFEEFYDAPFTAIVYVVIDQTMHALCLWAVVFYLGTS